MNIREVLSQFDNLKPNHYEDHIKVQWLSDLDGMIKAEIIDTHEGWDDVVFDGYNEDTDNETELLVKNPYTDIYLKYLSVQVDFNNGDFTSYNNSIIMFNSSYETYSKYYNRTHMPLQPATITIRR